MLNFLRSEKFPLSFRNLLLTAYFKIFQHIHISVGLGFFLNIQNILKSWWIFLAEMTQVQPAGYLMFYISDHFNQFFFLWGQKNSSVKAGHTNILFKVKSK